MAMRLICCMLAFLLAAPALADKAAIRSAGEVLKRARQAMGLERPRPVDSIYVEADCQGPERAFVTHVWSDYNGAVRFRQQHGGSWYRMGRDQGLPWSYDDGYTDGDAAMLSFLHGHEFHMLAIAPETRLGIPRDEGVVDFEGQRAHRLRLTDAMGAPAYVYYAVESGLPLGAAYENHMGRGPREITITFGSWPEGDGPRLFRRMDLRHGEERFSYDYTKVELDGTPDPDLHPGRDHDPDRGALLRLQMQAAIAHKMYDVELFIEPHADPLVGVSRGELRENDRASNIARLTPYFDRFTFTAWDDVAPPRIELSDDRSMATVIVQKRVAGFQLDERGQRVESETRFAWSETWRKRDGEWRLIAATSTND